MPRTRLTVALAASAAVFGLLTVASGGMALFGSTATKDVFGSVVTFVLWFNFLSGFAYLAAAYGLHSGRRWGGALAVFIAATTVLVFLGFGVAVALGVPFEMRTVAAMSIRSVFWLGVAWYATSHWSRQTEIARR